MTPELPEKGPLSNRRLIPCAQLEFQSTVCPLLLVLEMSQIVNDGKTIALGQSLAEIEEICGFTATDIPVRIARKGIDKSLKAENLSLEFDSGRLKRIRFEGDYKFKNPLEPYSEPWKNFDGIGSTRISGKMSREEFLAYLKKWEDRAKTLGAEQVEAGEDLGAEQYSVGIMQEDLMGFAIDMVVVNMGPSRRAGGGGLWYDGWALCLTTKSHHQQAGVEVGRLTSLSAFRDEFNTVARKKA